MNKRKLSNGFKTFLASLLEPGQTVVTLRQGLFRQNFISVSAHKKVSFVSE